MRNKKHIDHILAQLKVAWSAAPGLRLGQMLLNVYGEPTLYYVEDEELVATLKERLTRDQS